MCTLAVDFHPGAAWPVVVAANRDERLGRPAEGWAIRQPRGAPRFAAPRDLAAGGTWIGVSSDGLFAAVTNFHAGAGFPDPQRRSRGELVPRALAHRDARSARPALAGLDAAAYNPFHLLVADADHAFLWHYDGERSALDDLPPGLHVVTEADPLGRCARGDRVRSLWPTHPDPPRLREVLVQHAASREGTCIHLDPHYGTRSSAILRLRPGLEGSTLHAANGHPCVTTLEDLSPVLDALARDGAARP
jgi:uncharacterized protein with NRDE domain